MKTALFELFASKKFLAALTAIVIYVAGRFGFNIDTAVLDRIYAALMVYIGAQGIADIGKSAAQVTATATVANASASPAASSAPRPATTGIAGIALIALSISLASMSVA